VAKKIVYKLKYKPYVSDLVPLLSDLLFEGIIQNPSFMSVLPSITAISAIPLHSLKLRARGYNQAELLAKELGKKLHLPYQELLIRTKQTPSQVGLKKEDRKTNIIGAFLSRSNQKDTGCNILLVDDVLTTGATVSEAAKVLKKSGVKSVYGVTLARD
jgi:competence protein ComFC